MLSMIIRTNAPIKIVLVFVAILFFLNCSGKRESSVEPDLKIWLISIEPVKNSSENIFQFDAQKMLEDALKRNLESRNILWKYSPYNAKMIVAKTDIVRCEEDEGFIGWFIGQKKLILTVEMRLFDDIYKIKLLEKKQEFMVNASDPKSDWVQAIDNIAASFAMDLDSIVKR